MNVAIRIQEARNSYYSTLKEAGAMTPEEVNLGKVKNLVSRAYRAAKRFNELKKRALSREFFPKTVDKVFQKIGISKKDHDWLYKQICRKAQANSVKTRKRRKEQPSLPLKTNLWVSPSESLTQGTLFPATSFRNTKHLSQERPLSREECVEEIREFREALLS